MRLLRFALVWLAVALTGTGLGAAFGFLLGSAIPSKVVVEGAAAGRPVEPQAARVDESAGQVTLGATADVSPRASATLVGAAFGLLAGAGLGLAVSALDQIILAARRRREAAAPGVVARPGGAFP